MNLNDTSDSSTKKRLHTSVIIPIYNAGEQLDFTLTALRNQTDPLLEILCIDDASTDTVTHSVLERHLRSDARIRTFYKRNGGPECARECGKRYASGEFLAFCDQDDQFHPEALMHCFTLANSNHLDALFFRYAKWDGRTDCSCRLGSLPTPHLSVCTSTSSATDPNTLAASLHRIHIIPWAQYIRRCIASSLQMNKGSSLANTFAILRRSSRWASIPTELYFYNVNVTSSMMHKPFSVSQFELQRKDMERLFLLYQDVSPHLDLEWRVILKSFVVPQLKQFYNHLRRTKAQMNSADVAHALDIFSATLRFVFLKKNVPFGYIRMRQLMPFLILIFFHTPREPL